MAKASINLSAGSAPSADRGIWLDYLALALVLAVVIARALMMESLFDPIPVAPLQPGNIAPPIGAGPASGLVLDALVLIASMLPVVRRLLTRQPLCWAGGLIPLLLLGVWAVASTQWAGNRFSAIVMGSHLLAMGLAAWTLAQVVTTWKRLRIVAAGLVGLLACQVVDGLWYQFVELPVQRDRWVNDIDGTRSNTLLERGWHEGDFAAKQFEKRVLNGQPSGFTASPNSYSAILVMLGIVAVGAALQRASQRAWAWAGAMVVIVLLTAWATALAGSNTAALTPIIAIGAFALIALMGAWLQRHRRFVLTVCLLGFVVGTLLVVIAGIRYGSLGHVSMTFRWHYWIASAEMMREHPIAGVGYNNFGVHYLKHRIPEAAEEVQDPHNFIVRIASELGIVGLLLLIGWQVGLWRRLSRSTDRPADASAEFNPAIGWALLAVAIGGLLLNLMASVDFAQISAFITLELFQRLAQLCLLAGAGWLVLIESADHKRIDARPAPWLLRAFGIGAGIFLIHNLIDFSLFEIGPMFLFAVVIGAAIGMRGTTADQPPRRAITAGLLAIQGVILITGIATVIGPIALSEADAQQADLAVRQGRVQQATAFYERAAQRVPWNSSYTGRLAMAQMYAGAGHDAVLNAYQRAIEADPDSVKYYLQRGQYLANRAGRVNDAVADFDRAQALNPHDTDLRLIIAVALEQAGQLDLAKDTYRRALELNDMLRPDEAERLPDWRIEEIRRKIDP